MHVIELIASSLFTAEGADFTFQKLTDINVADSPPITVNFTFILDGVERELPKTFALELQVASGVQPLPSFFTDRIEMTIIDGDDPSKLSLPYSRTSQ